MTPVGATTQLPRGGRRSLSGVLLAGLLSLIAPATSSAAIMTVGSPLSVPATMNTTESLGYIGTYTPVPPAPDAPNGRYHTNHWGADTAIWNTALAAGSAGAPATGQAVKVRIEGCAQPAAQGPAPLTQFHIQDLSSRNRAPPAAWRRTAARSASSDEPIRSYDCGRLPTYPRATALPPHPEIGF